MDINDYDGIADLYDIYVPATFDIDFFVEETRKAAGEVLELMSGTGRVSIPLIKAGVKLTCVDLSAESNSILDRKLYEAGLKADVWRMDVCELELHRKFGMVIIPFHSFAHLTERSQQRTALERIRQHLAPGGKFICTLRNPRVRGKDIDGQLRLVGRYPLPESGGALLLWIVENFSEADKRVVQAVQLYEEYNARGVLRSKRMLELKFRLTERAEFEELAAATGFRVQAFYGDYSRAPFTDSSPFMIWILENAGA